MSKCAKPLATGPFHGFFHEGATLYRLDPPCVAGGWDRRRGVESREVTHVIVSALDQDEMGNGPQTVVFATDEQGVVDTDFYVRFGTIVDMYVNDATAALARLGYVDAR